MTGDQALPKLLERVNKGQSIVDQQHSRAYSLSGEAKYGLRGGRPYLKPKSWLRYALYVKDFHLYKDWCVAYHGTTSQNLPSILLQGLQNPGEPGVSILHGQSYSQTKRTIIPQSVDRIRRVSRLCPALQPCRSKPLGTISPAMPRAPGLFHREAGVIG